MNTIITNKNYGEFINESSILLKNGLNFLNIDEKKGKEYSDTLLAFLQGSTLIIKKTCNLDIEKRNKILCDILTELPIIDKDMFDFITTIGDAQRQLKPKNTTGYPFAKRSDDSNYNISKGNIKQNISDFVNQRTQNIEQQSISLYYDIEEDKNRIEYLNYQVNDLDLKELGYVEYENGDILTIEDIEKDILNLKDKIVGGEKEYKEYMKLVLNKKKKFEDKITQLVRKYIFAKLNPKARLKKSYIELFLLDKIDLQFLQGDDSYSFGLGEKTISLLYQQSKQIVDNFNEPWWSKY